MHMTTWHTRMHTHEHTYTYTHNHTHTYMCTHPRMQARTLAHMKTWRTMHTNTHTRDYVYLSLSRVHPHPLTHKHTCAHTHSRAHTHTRCLSFSASPTHTLSHTLHNTHLLRGQRDWGVIASKGWHGGGHDSEITGTLYMFSKSLLIVMKYCIY